MDKSPLFFSGKTSLFSLSFSTGFYGAENEYFLQLSAIPFIRNLAAYFLPNIQYVKDMKKVLIWLAPLLIAASFSCKKSDGNNGVGGTGKGTGSIYFHDTNEGIFKMDVRTGKKTQVLPYDVSRYYWDVSRDGKKILETSDPDDPNNRNYDLYKIRDANSGAVLSSFKWYSGYANATRPIFSPDGAMIAITAPYNGKIFIVDTQGNALYNIYATSGSFTGNLQWMPDNTLLFTINKTLYRSNTTFSDFRRIASFNNFNMISQLAANNAGTSLVFMGAMPGDDNAHLWMINTDGSGLKQITQGNETEGAPAFSPDGALLAFGSDLIQSVGVPWTIGGSGQGIALGSSVWGISIMPADGNTYNVENNNAVFHFPQPGKRNNRVPADSDPMEWR